MKYIFFILCLAYTFLGSSIAEAFDSIKWSHELKSKHFVVKYDFREDEAFARDVLNKAEQGFNAIAYQIGYDRLDSSWTWDDRVEILIFADANLFSKVTGQPAWSNGMAAFHDDHIRKRRLIVAHRELDNFIQEVLPHEVTHLVVRDYIGWDAKIPVWFDEGVAQLQEPSKKESAYKFMKFALSKDVYIPFEKINRFSPRYLIDPNKVSLFYAQSLTMIDFLIKKHGRSAFVNLCRALKDGQSMNSAITAAYPYSLRSMEDFELRWIQHLKSIN